MVPWLPKGSVCFIYLLIIYFEIGSHCVALSGPGYHRVPSALSAGIKGIHHHARPRSSLNMHGIIWRVAEHLRPKEEGPGGSFLLELLLVSGEVNEDQIG